MTAVAVVGIVAGLVAVFAALVRTPEVRDPNVLAPHDALTGDPITDDDPELPYGGGF